MDFKLGTMISVTVWYNLKAQQLCIYDQKVSRSIKTWYERSISIFKSLYASMSEKNKNMGIPILQAQFSEDKFWVYFCAVLLINFQKRNFSIIRVGQYVFRSVRNGQLFFVNLDMLYLIVLSISNLAWRFLRFRQRSNWYSIIVTRMTI